MPDRDQRETYHRYLICVDLCGRINILHVFSYLHGLLLFYICRRCWNRNRYDDGRKRRRDRCAWSMVVSSAPTVATLYIDGLFDIALFLVIRWSGVILLKTRVMLVGQAHGSQWIAHLSNIVWIRCRHWNWHWKWNTYLFSHYVWLRNGTWLGIGHTYGNGNRAWSIDVNRHGLWHWYSEWTVDWHWNRMRKRHLYCVRDDHRLNGMLDGNVDRLHDVLHVRLRYRNWTRIGLWNRYIVRAHHGLWAQWHWRWKSTSEHLFRDDA